MALLSAAAARALLAGFRGIGLDAEAIREAAGISRAALEPLDGVLPAEAFAIMWQEAFRRAPREELPTEVALAVPFGAFGPLDYLAASSADVASAFHSLAAWFRTVASGFSLEVERTGGGGEVRVMCGPDGPPPGRPREVTDEFTVAVTVGRFRSRPASHPFRVSEVRLTRAAPARPTRHEALLGAKVVFGCAVAAIRVPAEVWEAKLPSADPMLQETLRGLAERLELGAASSDLEQAVRARLRALLPQGGGDAREVARSLGMSARTLHRKLRAAGRSFGEVVDLFREGEAERLLTDRAASLSDVAYRLGFSDQSAFTRAFRRWKGAPPSAWLEAARARARPPAGAGTSRGRSRPRPS